jgi:rhodanese-related sulfurtransferase
MIGKIATRLFLISAVLISIGCVTGSDAAGEQAADMTDLSQLPKNTRGYGEITPTQLRSFLQEEEFLLVNVNGAAEEIIPGTDFTIPFEQLEENLDRFPGRDEPTVLYCQAGPLSRAASQDLLEWGFTNIIWLEGGISAWKRAGFEVESR